jgi:hypothetical protein
VENINSCPQIINDLPKNLINSISVINNDPYGLADLFEPNSD